MKPGIRLPAFASLQEHPLTPKTETVTTVVYSVIVFLFPLALGQDGIARQFAVGIVVNAFLALTALNLHGWKCLWIILLPAFAVLDRSLVLRQWQSIPLQLALLPFVWAANALFVSMIKIVYLFRGADKWTALLAACSGKALFLLVVAAVAVALKAVPESFYNAMGIYQFLTAAGGGLLAYLYQIIRYKVIVR